MANKVRTVFANMSWLMISQIITSLCAFLWTIITAWYLGPSEFGILGTATSFSVLLGVFADLGVTTYIVRAISTDFENEHKYLDNAITLKMLLVVFYLLVSLTALFILNWDSYVIFICFLFSIENSIKSFQGLFASSFQAHEKLKYQAIFDSSLNVSTLLLIVLVSFTDYGLLGITFAYIFANIIGLTVEVYLLRKNILTPNLSVNYTMYKSLLKASIPFALTTLFSTIYYSIDIVMITQFSGTYDTGLYNSAYKLISVLSLFYSIYTAVIFPVMSKLFTDKKDLLKLSFVKSIKYLSLITVPIAIFTFFYGYDIINIYGGEYGEAGGVLKILIWTVCFLFINGACSMVLNASYEEYSVTKIYSIAALFNVILNLFLIPRYSVYGASIATVVSEILILILELYMISKINQLPDRHFVYDIVKIAISSLLLGFILYILNLSMLFAIPVSIVVYLVVIVLIRLFDSDDKIILKQIISR